MHIVCPHCHKTNRVPTERLSNHPVCGACGAELFIGQPVALDDASLQRHIQRNEIPLLVDFWAPWCGPCRMMAPAFAEAAHDLEPQVRLAKLNTEAHPQMGATLGIRSIPTMVLFRAGQEVARVSGAMSAEQIKAWVKQHA